MNKHHLLCESQYGFRSHHSNVDAITEFVTKILPSLDKREICLLAYLDLSKAFDTINHDAMLTKLHYLLGPLLFIIYANDIPHSITPDTTIMFADDTTVRVRVRVRVRYGLLATGLLDLVYKHYMRIIQS